MTGESYVQWLKDAYETRIARLEATNVQQARDLILLHLQLKAATDMADCLKRQVEIRELLIDTILDTDDEEEPEDLMQAVVDKAIVPAWGRTN